MVIALVKDTPGKVLAGKYELIERAGSGGMAVVWRGRTLGAAGFSRPIAVKRIVPHLATNPEFVAMFVEESRVVSELPHPAITQIHDFAVDEHGHHFLVMEWVEGVDLQELIDHFVRQSQPTPWPIMTALAIEVLGGLGAAHDRKDHQGASAPIFHRDVTPHNIRVSAGGYVKLTDFGIARAADRATMTRPDALKGKLSYVAPEQLRGKPASARTDLFCVGICLWEALAGRRLFEAASDMQVMFMVHEAKVPELRSVRPDLPENLAAAVHCALSREPTDRFETTHAMARALADVLRTTREPTDARTIAELVKQTKSPTNPDGTLRPRTEVLDLSELDEIE